MNEGPEHDHAPAESGSGADPGGSGADAADRTDVTGAEPPPSTDAGSLPTSEQHAESHTERVAGGGADLGAIERDLAGVAAALRRLDEGTYWSDEITGEPIPDAVLAADPVARRAT